MTGNGYGFNTSTFADDTSDFGTTGGVFNGFDYTKGETTGTVRAKIDIGRIFLPLNFWFCRNPGLALPLIALQYHEVKVKMTFETLANLGRLLVVPVINLPIALSPWSKVRGLVKLV